MDLAVLIELVLRGIALVRESRSQKSIDLNRAIKATRERFSDIPGAEVALEKWIESSKFAELLQRLQTGERDFDPEEVVSSFINDGGFHMPSRTERQELAGEIVFTFFGKVLEEIHRSSWGISALDNRAEERHAEVMGAVKEVHADLIKAQSLVADPRASAVSADPALEPGHDEAKKKIDIARKLIGLGHIQDARRELEEIGDLRHLPEDLQFRVITNFGVCSLDEGDHESACAHFEEAYQLQPDNPKGITNAAIAALHQKDIAKAIHLAQKALALAPRSGHAAAIMIESLWRAGQTGQLREFVAEHAWVTSNQQAALALADVRAKQSRYEEAAQLCLAVVDDDPKNAGAYIALSQALFAEAQTAFGYGGSAEGTTHERLKESEEAATRAIELLSPRGHRSQLSIALVVRGFARALRGHIDPGLGDLDEAIRADPGDISHTRVRGLVLMMAGRYDEARDAFEQVRATEASGDIVAPLAEAYLRLGDLLAARELIRGQFNFENPGPEDLWKAELVCRVDAETAGKDPAWQAFEESLRSQPDDPWLLAVSAIRQQSLGDFEGAEGCLQKALSRVDAPERAELLFRLGNLYRESGRFSEAADAFVELVDGSARHSLAVDLLVCLAESRRLREALSWAQEIRETRVDVPKHVVDAEAQILEIAGDLRPAVALREQICAHPDANAADRVRLALLQFRAGLRAEAAETASIIAPSDLCNEPRLLLELAKLKLVVDAPGALEDAYLARRYGIDDPETHIGYFAIHSALSHEMVQPEVVEPGCAVQLRDDLTKEESWWSVLDDADEHRDHHELAADDELAKRLLGKRTGCKIEIRGDLEERSYEVVNVQSKFVRAFQETFEEFSTRFPNDTRLSRIVMEEGDFTKLLQAIEQRAQHVHSAEETYRDEALPFATFSSLIGYSPVEVWRACTISGSVPVRFAMGTKAESTQAGDVLLEAKGIVLDLLALLTVHELNLANQLRARFDHVAVPQHVVDELQAVHTMAMTMQGDGYIGKADDGQYVFSDHPENSVVAWQDFTRSVLEYAEALERVPAYDVLAIQDAMPLVSVLTISGVRTICADSRLNDTPLVMAFDDLGLATLARATGREVVNSQSLLRELRRSGTIDDEKYSSAVGRLASMHYTFVNIEADDIVRCLKANGYFSNKETRAMLSTLRGPHCDEQAAALVAARLISQVFDKVPLRQLDMLLELTLDVLCRNRATRSTLIRFRELIASDSRLALSPWHRDRVLDRVDTQVRLHSEALA